MDVYLTNPHIKQIVEAWPIYAVIGTILTTLTIFYFNGRVEEIADARIETQVPTHSGYLDVKARIATLENDGGDVEDDVARIETQLTRVEGKIDDLLLIMQRPSAP